MRLADRIRGHVIDEIIAPARRGGATAVAVRAGDVHAALGLKDRMPAVCGALDAAVFCETAGVVLKQRLGPRQGATAEWILSL